MDIQYSEYTLLPKKRANRLSSLEAKRGVFLKTMIQDVACFADYFPHPGFGDRSVDQFLTEFKHQKEDYDKKVLHLLNKDYLYRHTPPIGFRNHQLWTKAEDLKSSIVKYKIMERTDDLYLGLLERGVRIRFDGNAFFDRESLEDFLRKMPKKYLQLIDYMEDPFKTTDWSGFPIKMARDFIEGDPFSYTVYKPNVEFFPTSLVPVIFSAYMGSDFGTWHAYCELVERGDFKLTHGLVTENFYEEQKPLFIGDYSTHFAPDLRLIGNLYQELSARPWKTLCSI